MVKPAVPPPLMGEAMGLKPVKTADGELIAVSCALSVRPLVGSATMEVLVPAASE